MRYNVGCYLPESILRRQGRKPKAGHHIRPGSHYNVDAYLPEATLKRLGRTRPVYREPTAEERRVNLVRYSYSANRGYSYRTDKQGNPSAEYLRELAGKQTFWDRVRSAILNIG